MSFPVDDWQFWLASVIVLIAAVVAFRAVVPLSLLTGRARKRGKRTRVSLTIGGEKPNAGVKIVDAATPAASTPRQSKDCNC